MDWNKQMKQFRQFKVQVALEKEKELVDKK
jgi:hypothetical protein